MNASLDPLTENGSLLVEAETLEELREVIDRQMAYYNERRRHSSLAYRPPVEYLKSQGIHVDPLALTDLSTGSAAGAQVQINPPTLTANRTIDIIKRTLPDLSLSI